MRISCRGVFWGGIFGIDFVIQDSTFTISCSMDIQHRPPKKLDACICIPVNVSF